MEQMNSLVEYGSRRVIITVTAILCALLEIVDTTIVNVAVSDMQGSLGATLNEVGWVITAYAIGNVIIVPMTSFLSQQFGRRIISQHLLSCLRSALSYVVTLPASGNLYCFAFYRGSAGEPLLGNLANDHYRKLPVEKRGMAQAIYGLGRYYRPHPWTATGRLHRIPCLPGRIYFISIFLLV
jgi:DHA2 family multidrug resistance protein